MDAWDEDLQELRGEFVQFSRLRLEKMAQRLARCGGAAADRQALDELQRDFHSFAGSGATFGLAQISLRGVEGERICTALFARGTDPDRAEIDRLRSLLELLAADLRAADLTAADPPAEPLVARREQAVLVVETEGPVRRRLAHLLDEAGLTSSFVASQREALASLEEAAPLAVVAAAELPDGSGYELAEEIRGRSGGDHPIILILGSRRGFLDKVEAIRCGADGYFEKRTAVEDLVRRLQRLLAERSAPAGRILAVEDDPQQAAAVRAILESGGFEVHGCDDPRRFEEDLLAVQPDLVLMDIVLPGISGYELARFVRQGEGRATLPVLFLTTEGQLAARLEAVRAGGDDHLVKPVPPELLLSAVTARLNGLLERDGLTRLLTRAAFLERVEAALAEKRRDPRRSMAWVMLDLDRFKSINDSHGHPAGDRVLQAFADLLRRRLRQVDTVGRIGGEEFAVLLEDLSAYEVLRLVDRLREEFRALAHPATDGSTSFYATFSAGISLLSPDGGVNEWREEADRALYAAKAAGRDRVKLAPPAARQPAVRVPERDLRPAMVV
ncbi:MAG TPA: diguanylate cyclase [Thermoanaerobaculia bacterium]|nr:diguanylate cyclase [Thermoanaerobaculia bacterium]